MLALFNIRNVDHLLVSGSDSGEISVWDLRSFYSSKDSSPNAAATFTWHTKPITSVGWHPTDPSVFAATGADDQLTIWDLALESEGPESDIQSVPPQLLFVHQGQKDMKEFRWNRTKGLEGLIISTSYDGFNIFKTINA